MSRRRLALCPRPPMPGAPVPGLWQAVPMTAAPMAAATMAATVAVARSPVPPHSGGRAPRVPGWAVAQHLERAPRDPEQERTPPQAPQSGPPSENVGRQRPRGELPPLSVALAPPALWPQHQVAAGARRHRPGPRPDRHRH